MASALAFAYLGALLVMLRTRDDARLLSDARMDEGENVRPTAAKASPARAEKNGQLLERLGLVVASGLGVAVFFGGWQLPGGVEARSTVLQVAAALALRRQDLGRSSRSCSGRRPSPPPGRRAKLDGSCSAVSCRRLAVGAVLVAVSRKLGPSESLEAAVGAAVVTALVLIALRAALRIRGAMLRPEPHASPFL